MQCDIWGLRRRQVTICAIAALLVLPFETAKADESGISFWLPGLFGSLAAVPVTPGWSLGSVYYHASVKDTGGAAAAREIQIGRFSPTVNVNLNVNLNAQADLLLLSPDVYLCDTSVGRTIGRKPDRDVRAK